ncbi:odorant receptor 63a-like [Wyeomyia smithii]|uniref:odorant receptor 63a-like n=1 Tax=Wyeomyia smithii TaxID=174621 RepID=UPI002467B91D|nr:odorant receptor 63a-like [Wyeomyia smithii]
MGWGLKIRNIVSAKTPNFHRTYAVFHIFMVICGLDFFDDDFMVGTFNTLRFLGPLGSIAIAYYMCIAHIIRYIDDTDSLILSLAAFISGTELVLKITGMVLNRAKGARLIATALNDKSYEDGPMERFIFLKYHKMCRKLMLITLFSYPATALMMLSYPVIAGKLDEYMLPIGYSIPHISHKQQPWYSINYFMISVQTIWLALAFMGLDGPFYIYLCYSTCKLEILKNYVDQIGESDDIEEQRNLMRKIIGIHADILRFLKECSNFFRDIYLAQVLCSIAHICMSLFHVQLKFKNSSYGMLVTNVVKMWIFCYCGELVVTKSNQLSTAMYNNRWYRLWRNQDLKAIQFILANTQTAAGFSVGGFGILSYETFTVIMKTAYSCNAFLHNVMK